MTAVHRSLVCIIVVHVCLRGARLGARKKSRRQQTDTSEHSRLTQLGPKLILYRHEIYFVRQASQKSFVRVF